jgi:hypothetical protein
MRVNDPLEGAVKNLNDALEAPGNYTERGAILALVGIGQALITIADEMRKARGDSGPRRIG